MRINKIELFRINLQFKESFKHSLMDRSESASIILKLASDDDLRGYLCGYGESIARDYLTGESTESMVKDLTIFLKKMKKLKPEFKSFEEIKIFIKKINLRPAAKSCIDLALLDLGSKYFKAQMLEPEVNEIYYSAPVSLSSGFPFFIKLLKIKFFGIKHVKIKLDSDIAQNEERLKVARMILGKRIRIGVDANCSWTKEIFGNMISILEKYEVSFCEQPLSKKELFSEDLQNLTKIPIMADESFISLADAKKLTEKNSAKILNIRIAKLGGIIAAQEAIEFARKNKLQFQIGCLAGESGILSAAGRVLAAHNPDAISVEGSYGKYILKQDIIKQDISFGRYGKALIVSGLNSEFGLGIEINDELLKNNLVLLLEKT